MNTNGQDPNKGRRLKTIIATVVAAIVIVLVGFWAISSALNSGKKTDDNSKTTEVAKTTEKEKEKTESTGTKPTSPSDQYTPTAQTETQVQPQAAPAPVAENPIPTTGPSEIIFSALMVGVVAALAVLNIELVKDQN